MVVRPKVWTGERPKSSRNMPDGGSSGGVKLGSGSKPASASAWEKISIFPDFVPNDGSRPSSIDVAAGAPTTTPSRRMTSQSRPAAWTRCMAYSVLSFHGK